MLVPQAIDWQVPVFCPRYPRLSRILGRCPLFRGVPLNKFAGCLEFYHHVSGGEFRICRGGGKLRYHSGIGAGAAFHLRIEAYLWQKK